MKKVAVGVDIGGTNSVYGLVDDQGHILSEGVFPTRNYPDSDLYIEELYIGIQNLLKAAGDEVELVGVGIGAPNGNYYRGTIENAPNLPWEGTDQRGRKDEALLPHPARHSDQRCERRGRRRNDLRRSERHEGLSGRHARDRSGQRLRGQRPTDLRIYRIRR